MLDKICFCQLGMMSQCVAASRKEQKLCWRYDKSIGSDKCMNLDESINNHCWDIQAQAFSKKHGVVRPEDVDYREPERTIEREQFPEDTPQLRRRRSCRYCILYACSKLIKLNQASQAHGGLSAADMHTISIQCPDYCDASTINQLTKNLQRGIKP